MAIVPPGAPVAAYPETPVEAKLTTVEDTRMTADVSAPSGGFLVLSEAYYPGWRATVDGQPTPVYRADVMFQGVAVPPGHHVVTFALESTTLRVGIALSALALACTLFLAI